MRYVWLYLLVAFLHLNRPCSSFRVLGLFPVPARSHFNFAQVILKKLAAIGHEVHVVSHFPQTHPPPRYVDISIKGSSPLLNNVSIDETAQKYVADAATDLYKDLGRVLCQNILNSSKLEELKRSTVKYDLVLMEVHATDCLIAFADVFKAPIVGLSSAGYLPWAMERMGNPDNPSYITNYFVPFSGKMVLLEKIQVAFGTIFSKFGYHVLSTIPSEMKVRDFFGGDVRPLDEIAFGTSLLLVNAHFSINDPKPTVPGVVEVGGLHIGGTAEKTPNDLLPHMSSKSGIIYLSFGSILNLTTMDPAKLQSLFSALEKLPQTVLIKADSSPESIKLPKNVVVRNWYPQLHILCHANTKLFITHGGALSMQEAAYCGVPVLGIPIFPENELLVRTFEAKGTGSRLAYEDLTQQNLDAVLAQLLSNVSYKEAAGKLSTLFNDRPMSPVDTAVYWVEYVHKHAGAPQLRSRAVDIIWFEYYMLDVAIVVAAFVLMLFYGLAYLLEFLQNYFDAAADPADHSKKAK